MICLLSDGTKYIDFWSQKVEKSLLLHFMNCPGVAVPAGSLHQKVPHNKLQKKINRFWKAFNHILITDVYIYIYIYVLYTHYILEICVCTCAYGCQKNIYALFDSAHIGIYMCAVLNQCPHSSRSNTLTYQAIFPSLKVTRPAGLVIQGSRGDLLLITKWGGGGGGNRVIFRLPQGNFEGLIKNPNLISLAEG